MTNGNYGDLIIAAIEAQKFELADQKTLDEIRAELHETIGEDFVDVAFAPADNNLVVECKDTTYKINSTTLQMFKETND